MANIRITARVTLLVVLANPGATLLAQPLRTVAVPSKVSCEKCDVVLRDEVTLGTGSALLGILSGAVAHDRAGRFFASTFDMNSVAVYDSLGKQVAKFGRDGAGPGEFRSVVDIKIGAADSLWIGDLGRRVSVFSSSLVFARSFTYSGDFSRAVLLPTGGFLAESKRGTLAEYSRDGKEDSARPVSAALEHARDPRCRNCDVRSLSSSRRPGKFWSWVRNRYEIEELDLGAEVQRRYVRQVPWFEPWTAEAELIPLPRVSGVREDSVGRLWVVIHVPDARWEPSTGPTSLTSAADYDRLYDSIIEVIDLQTGWLITSKRLPAMLALMQDGLAFTLRDDMDGRIVIDVWSLRLLGLTK